MQKRIKKILVLIFVVLFFSAVPVAIFYSQGLRIDFENKKIVKTGGLSFKVWPKQCRIYVDDKFKKKTDFLLGEAFIKNLLPQKYDIRIEKTGYFPWSKTLEVKEGLVTEAKNVILFPQKNNFSFLLPSVKDYFFSPDQKKAILEITSEEGWRLEILYLEENTQEALLKEEDLAKEANFIGLEWSPDSRNILIEVEIEKENKYFLFNTLDKKEISLDYFNKIKEVSFNPGNSQEVFVIKEFNGGVALFKSNYSQKQLAQPLIKDLITYKISEGNILWLNPDGMLILSGPSGEKFETLTTELFPIKEEATYDIETFSPLIFLKENGDLWQMDSSEKKFEKFFDSSENLKLSPDSKKLAIANNYEIWILFLTNISEQPQRSFGDKIFLTRFSQKINDLFWLNPEYLIFDTGDKIKIAEIDNRDRLNIVEIESFKDPQIFWNEEFERLFMLSENNLYSLTSLLP